MNLSPLTKLGKKSPSIKQNCAKILVILVSCIFYFSLFGGNVAIAQTALETSLTGLPALNIINSDGATGTTYSLSLQILALMTALTILPSLVLGMTSFTRVIIVLSILRQAMGTQQTPPNQVLIAIALFLTFFIMAPTFETLYDDAISPYLDGQMEADIAISDGTNVMKKFLVVKEGQFVEQIIVFQKKDF